MIKKDKIAWIFPGGGGRAAYTAGSCYAAHKLKLLGPDIIIAASGSAGTAYYFMANQYSSIKKIWCDLVCTKKFVNLWRFWKILNLDYLINEIFQIQEPLKINKVYNSKIKLFVALTSEKDGELKFFSNRDKVNLWSLLRATKTTPIFSGLFYRKKIIINKEAYFDTRISSRYELNLKKAISEGANKIIIFDNYHPHSSITSGKMWYNLWLFTRNKIFRKKHLAYLAEQDHIKIQKNIKVLHLKPLKKLEMPAWGNNKKQLNAIFNQGYTETINNEELKNF